LYQYHELVRLVGYIKTNESIINEMHPVDKQSNGASCN